jgi:PleD family two-component response regulator
MVRRDGTEREFATRIETIRDERGEVERYHVLSRDITAETARERERQAAADDLERQATRDELTGLLNRRGFLDRGRKTSQKEIRSSGA